MNTTLRISLTVLGILACLFGLLLVLAGVWAACNGRGGVESIVVGMGLALGNGYMVGDVLGGAGELAD